MMPHNLEALERTRQACRKLVSRRALYSAAAAALPIPGADLSVDVAILLQVLPQINHRFGLTPEQVAHLSPEVRSLIVVSSANLSLGLIGKVITPQRINSLLKNLGATRLLGKYGGKYLPVVGTAVASGLSYVILRKIGYKHIDECYHIVRDLLTQKKLSSENKPTTRDSPHS